MDHTPAKPRRKSGDDTAATMLNGLQLIVTTPEQLQQIVSDAVAKAIANTKPTTPTLLDMAGLGRALGLSAPSVRKLIRAGAPFLSCGDLKRFDLAAVCSWLASRRNTPSVEPVPELEAS